MNKQVLWYVAQGLVAITCFASIPVAVRLVSADPMTIGFVRLLIAVIVGYFILVRGAVLKTLTRRDWF